MLRVPFTATKLGNTRDTRIRCRSNKVTPLYAGVNSVQQRLALFHGGIPETREPPFGEG